MSRRLKQRIEWRLRHHSLQFLLAVAGRPIRCAGCGRELFRALPFVGCDGRLKLLGAREVNVRVAFRGQDSLQFSHLELDSCPSPDRPWVR